MDRRKTIGKTLRRLLLLPVLVFPTCLYAQQQSVPPTTRDELGSAGDIRFERITLRQGLSPNSVNAILQDHRGFMWFGTQDGLNRYDGYRFAIYRHASDDPHSLSHDQIRAMIISSRSFLKIDAARSG